MARGSPAEKAKILERQLQALEYRKSGWSYRAIAARLGVDHTTIIQDVNHELARLAAERDDRLEENRQLELERADMLLKALEPMAKVGNPAAVQQFLKAMERRARLLGLDAPTVYKMEGGLTADDVNKLVRAIEARGLKASDVLNQFYAELAAGHQDSHPALVEAADADRAVE